MDERGRGRVDRVVTSPISLNLFKSRFHFFLGTERYKRVQQGSVSVGLVSVVFGYISGVMECAGGVRPTGYLSICIQLT